MCVCSPDVQEYYFPFRFTLSCSSPDESTLVNPVTRCRESECPDCTAQRAESSEIRTLALQHLMRAAVRACVLWQEAAAAAVTPP